MEPPIGFEPMTYGLQDRRSTSWAMVAHGRDCIETQEIANSILSCFGIYLSPLRTLFERTGFWEAFQ